MLILTGPTAAGKNTIGHMLAHQRPRCAVVDFDLVRAMFVQPHRAPWQGQEGRQQHLLGVDLVSQLAHGFAMAGWDVIILDVLTDEITHQYRTRLAPFTCTIVQLLPTFAEVKRRFDERGPVLTDAELVMVYEQQVAYAQYDYRLDNTVLSPAQVAMQIMSLWNVPSL
ncbi:MAG: hypothetical protein M3R24_29260 [Chloroflexota bacterium]|nr:hypothetical protein [Chloroflexota bacterium]